MSEKKHDEKHPTVYERSQAFVLFCVLCVCWSGQEDPQPSDKRFLHPRYLRLGNIE